MGNQEKIKEEFSLDWLEGGGPVPPKKPAKVVWIDGKAVSGEDHFMAPAIDAMGQKKDWHFTTRHYIFGLLLLTVIVGFAVSPKERRKARSDINNDGISMMETFPAFEGIENSKILLKEMTYYKLKFPWKQPIIQSTNTGKRVVIGTVEAGDFEWEWSVTWQWQSYEWRPISGVLGPITKEFHSARPD
jgi:hypothetical protein